MSFATDFSAHVETLCVELQAKRAAVIDAVYELSLLAQRQEWVLSQDDRLRLQELRRQEAVVDAEILRLQRMVVTYRDRERSEQRERLKQAEQVLEQPRRAARRLQSRTMWDILIRKHWKHVA